MSQIDDRAIQDAEPEGVLPALEKWALPLTALFFLAVHLALRFRYGATDLGKGLDPIALVLIGIGVIPVIPKIFPYIAPYVASAKIAGFEVTLRETKQNVEDLQLFISTLLSTGEAEALKRVHDDSPTFSQDHHRPGLTDDLRRLRDLRMIDQSPLFKGRLTDLTHGRLGEQRIKAFFSLTAQGRMYYDKRLAILGADSFEIAQKTPAPGPATEGGGAGASGEDGVEARPSAQPDREDGAPVAGAKEGPAQSRPS